MKPSDLPPRPPIKLFFDENCSTHLIRELEVFFQPDYQDDGSKLDVDHIAWSFGRGAKDPDWISKLGSDWIVITEENSRRTKQAKALIVFCRERDITHLLISSSLQKKSVQKEAICQAWKFIRVLPYLPKGTEIRLRRTQAKGGLTYAILAINGKRMDFWCKENGIVIPE